MVTHYFTLQALQKEFHSLLCGATIEEIFSQQKNELIISVGDRSLLLSIDPVLNYAVLRDRVARARRNSADLFQELVGSTIVSFDLHPTDRTFQCLTSNRLTLCIQLYNSASSNIALTGEDQVIRAAFKNNKEKEGNHFTIESKEFDNRLLDDSKLFAKSLQEDSTKTILAALKQAVPVLGAQFTKELLHRVSIEGSQLVATLSSDQTDGLHKKLKHLLASVEHPQPTIYFNEGDVKAFSVVPLESLGGYELSSYPNTNSAVQAFLSKSFRAKGKESAKKKILEKLNAELKRTGRSLAAITTQLEDGNRAEEYERKGKLLLANITSVHKGMREVAVSDFVNPETTAITLNPTITPSANAEQYFEKAKKARVARKESAERVSSLKTTIQLLERMIETLEPLDTLDEIKDFQKQHEKELLAMKIISPSKGQELPPFRIFSVEGGYEVWVGKSSANNDLLTMKYAKPNDLWFHVRGASGSHTVLKVTGSELPSKKAVEQAASIAAYYSKMRKAGSVPVAYCERKYVRKPKGMAQGAVFLEREKTILVKPGLP